MDSVEVPQINESNQKLVELIKGIKITMMTTVDRQDQLRSRPMQTLDREYDGSLWFFTPMNTAKVDEIEHDARVNLSYSKPESNSYVSVSGTARLVRDDEIKKNLWQPEFKAWAPLGPEDTNLALLQITVDAAEYWDAPSGAMVYLIGLAKAALTGQPYAGELADHAKVQYL